MNNVAIIGGGVIGVTTAISLQLNGYNTTIYTKHRPDKENQYKASKALTSMYAAASVKPSTVYMNNISKILSTSQSVYEILYEMNYPINIEKHYVLSENELKIPDYVDELNNYNVVKNKINIPKRKNISNIYGWYFDTYFINMIKYISDLYDLYLDIGGNVEMKSLSKNNFSNLSENIIINCTGNWSRDLFNDNKMYAYRGHLIHIPIEKKLVDNKNKYISYSYTTKNNNVAYVYSRENKLILGGTTQKGIYDSKKDKWISDNKLNVETIKIGENNIPEHILNVNREILSEFINIDINIENAKSVIGYRPVRHENVRIDTEKINNKLIIHNYGHGGSGVTLSWGCAKEVINLLKSNNKYINKNKLHVNNDLNKIKNILNK